jgi:predicted Zn-dependent peptidase
MRCRVGLAGVGVVLTAAASARGASLEELARHVSEFQLPNGMRFAAFERHESPMVAVRMIVRVGPSVEPPGKTGISRLFPRMFPHGGAALGSAVPATEKEALARVEKAYDAWKRLQAQRPAADPVDVSRARVEFQIAIEQSSSAGTAQFAYRAMEELGAISVESRASADYSHYSAVLPANGVEAWFKLVSDWLRRPSTRQFYPERDRWLEETQRAAQNSAETIVEEAILSGVFGRGGYGRNVVPPAEGAALRVSDFEAFARAHYTPENTVVAVAGDMGGAEIRRLAEQYFGPLARGGESASAGSGPAPRFADDRVVNAVPPTGIVLPVVIGWPRPPRNDSDDAVFDVIWGLLSVGSDALLSRTFEDQKVMASASVIPNFPGDLFWSIFAVSAVPARAVEREAVENGISRAIATLRDKPVALEKLAKVKRILATQLISETETISGMCGLLGRYLAADGSAAMVASALSRIEKVTAEDIERVARKHLREKGRVILRVGSPAAGAGS